MKAVGAVVVAFILKRLKLFESGGNHATQTHAPDAGGLDTHNLHEGEAALGVV